MIQQQQMMKQQQMIQQKDEPESVSIIDKIQSDWKPILLVVVLSIAMNIGFVDSIFKMNDNLYFIRDDGSLNTQAILIKGIIIGCLFFLINNSIRG